MVGNLNIDVKCKVIKIMPLYYRWTFKNYNIMALFVSTYSISCIITLNRLKCFTLYCSKEKVLNVKSDV